jgi:hypothetical protein
MHAGLCDACRWQREVVSGRGSRFSLCERSAQDPRYPKYPRLPVADCAGYEPRGPEEGESGSSSAPSPAPS